MKLTEEHEKIIDAGDIVCLNCVRNTLEDNSCCDICPVRALVDTIYDSYESKKEGNDMKWGDTTKGKKIIDVLEDEGLRYTIYKYEATIEFWTDKADQDIVTEFSYDGTAEDFVKQFVKRAEWYDVDDEVALYADCKGKNGVPDTIRELLDDCQEAKDTLMEIAEALQNALKGE